LLEDGLAKTYLVPDVSESQIIPHHLDLLDVGLVSLEAVTAEDVKDPGVAPVYRVYLVACNVNHLDVPNVAEHKSYVNIIRM
jgi:hypothetical protein